LLFQGESWWREVIQPFALELSAMVYQPFHAMVLSDKGLSRHSIDTHTQRFEKDLR
jgi:hypothetical protein